MRKVLVYSLLLVLGLIGSQLLGGAPEYFGKAITLATMFALSFIMIHVGYEFELDKSRPRQYAWDYFVAATAATFPWILCTLYFVFALNPRGAWDSGEVWRGATLQGLFASPTSAGVLFSMLAAAGLGATWVFRKARILAIFDDLNTILLLIPLKMMMIGPRWQLGAVALIIIALLWVAYRYLNTIPLPITWPWVMAYAAGITLLSQLIHLEVLLPAFALGCVLKTPPGQDPHVDDAREGTEEGPELPREQAVSTIVSAVFMVLVGLSMPPIRASGSDGFSGWGIIAVHVLFITLLSNLGKMFPAMCYRHTANWRERLALAVGMFPRGEVGAGVLVVALGYGLAGTALTVAVLSLALNLMCTGVFIIIVKRLLVASSTPSPTGRGLG